MSKTITSGNALRSVVEERLAEQGETLPKLLSTYSQNRTALRKQAADITERTGVVVSFTTIRRWAIQDLQKRSQAASA